MKLRLIVLLTALVFESTPLLATAAPAKGIKLIKASCVHVNEGIVLPLLGFRYEMGRLRCTARLTVDRKVQHPDATLIVALLQEPEQAGQRPERGKVARKARLWPGFNAEVEGELPLPESLNGCMPFTLVVEIAGQMKRVQARPRCED